MTELSNRYDFAFFFDVADGNPNGDPDAGNLPRIDPETRAGLVSDVAIKRKIRNYVALTHEGEEGFDIYMAERAVLNEAHARPYKALSIKQEAKKLPKGEQGAAVTRWMCKNYFDIRTFGAVMSTDVNAGQVRGPVQITFSRSVEPVTPIEVSITRSSVTNQKDIDKERTMGRKYLVPYGLYRGHGYINAKLAQRTGFSEEDLALFWRALGEMFEHDRSAARGEMACRRVIAFRHASALGEARAHELFERIEVERLDPATRGRAESERVYLPVGDPRTHNWEPARGFSDYRISVNRDGLPEGVEIVEFG